MRVKDQREKAKEALDLCEMHWIATDVPVEKIEEMRDELYEHLQEAIHDGKPVEAVVGTDPIAFAEDLAAPVRPRKSPKWKVLGLVTPQIGYAVFLMLLGHLWYWSLDFPVTPLMYAFALIAMLFSSLDFGMRMPMATSLRFDGPPVQQAVIIVGITISAAAAIVGVNLAVNFGDAGPLSHWSWPATLIVAVAAFFLPARPKQDLDKLPPRPDQRVRGRR
ncbi:MAG: hypothetical protein M3Q60_22400 [Actinomycetota bacterium]|nr:hypothetical protein [Actinomycetota bacterium]